ncbi:hypothetical protein HanIR_Chr05g0224471 [Helianthus annuus]|nr:hypothetical protein HanIR_Chr05g0224471 [Helianthus annuus]
MNSLLLNEAFTWWNLQVQTIGSNTTKRLLWEELKNLKREKYCSLVEKFQVWEPSSRTRS